MKGLAKAIWHIIKNILRRLGVPEARLMAVKPACKRAIACCRKAIPRKRRSLSLDHDLLVQMVGADVDSLSSYERELRLTMKTIIDCWEEK